MKSMKLMTLTGLMLSIGTVAVFASDPVSPTTQSAPAKPPATQPAATTAPAVPVNKFCPVSGDKVNPKGKTVVYKGKVIGFCCDDCNELFNKNPEKYADKIK